MTPYRACDVELAARVSKLALSFSSQNIRLPLHQCIVSPLRLLPFFSSFLFLVAEQGSIYARQPPSSLSPSHPLAFPLPPPSFSPLDLFILKFFLFFVRSPFHVHSQEKSGRSNRGFLSFLFLSFLFDLYRRFECIDRERSRIGRRADISPSSKV